MELVRSLYENEWIFRDPALTEEVENRFDEALDAYEEGRVGEAESLARSVVAECPDHIDAVHHLGLYCENDGDAVGSYAFCQAAVAIGLHAIPAAFNWDCDRIPWGFMSNRPFLCAYHSLGVHRMESGAWQAAITIFKRLLAVNPNDNQGVRYILPTCWFETNDVAAVIAHCGNYPEDAGPDILYSRALALLIAGRVEDAHAAIGEAVRASPLIARELIKRLHVEPERRNPGRITVGGAAEAWEYWRRSGRYWSKSKAAMALLREATAKAH